MNKSDLHKPKSFLEKLKDIFAQTKGDDLFDAVEEELISSDISAVVADELMEEIKKNRIFSYEKAIHFLKHKFINYFDLDEDENENYSAKGLKVIILTGINGVGKTTTAAKLAALYKKNGKKVMLAAADTFRAAAVEQLEMWAKKIGVGITKGMNEADPASVAFDGVEAANNGGYDIVIIDTAGRLHTKNNLMQELEKIKRIVSKNIKPENVKTYIIIDANTGKNSINQADEFNRVLKLDGMILTKFDSGAKGGGVIHIKSEFNIPVKYVTFGETENDIKKFNAKEFVDAMFE